MSDDDIIKELTKLACMIAKEQEKTTILSYISCIVQKIKDKQDNASDYIDSLLKDLK